MEGNAGNFDNGHYNPAWTFGEYLSQRIEPLKRDYIISLCADEIFTFKNSREAKYFFRIGNIWSRADRRYNGSEKSVID